MTGSAITLRNVGSSTDITLAKDHVSGDLFGDQQLFLAGSALHTASGGQQVYERLTGSLPSATERLMAADGSSIRAAAPPPGDGKTSASARGGGGGGVEVSIPSASATINPTVKAYIASTTVTVGGDVTVTSGVTTNVTASTDNGSGGFIAVSDVESSINGTDNNSAFIGADFLSSGFLVTLGPRLRRSTPPASPSAPAAMPRSHRRRH